MVVAPDKKQNWTGLYGQMSLLLAIPALLAVGPLVGLFIGRFLDELLHTEPYLMYLFITLGFVAAGKEVYRLIKRVSDKA